MSLRWEFTRDTRFNVPYKIEIYDSEFSGTSTDLGVVGGVPVEVTMGTRNGDPLEKIKGSSITVRLWGQQGDFEDLFDRNNERFLIKLYIDGNHEADFIPIPDTFKDYETGGYFTNEIKAANLSLFKQKQIDDMIGTWPSFGPVFAAVSRLQVIEDITSQLFSMNIVDGVVFNPSHIAPINQSLSNQYVNPQRLKGLNCYEALEMLIPKGHQMRVSKGKIFILPVTEASFVGWENFSPETYDDNFVSTKIGGRLSKERTKLVTYDGVRRFYNPLEADNIVPSGEFELEDFGLNEGDIDSSGETQALPLFWSATRGLTETKWRTFAKIVSGGTAWKIPESRGTYITQDSIEAGGTKTWESWKVDSGQVVAGNRLKIDFLFNYVSINQYAYLPIKIRVGGYDLSGTQFTSDNRFSFFSPEWIQRADGVRPAQGGVLIGRRANTGMHEWSFVTPPIPETGDVTVEIETPTVNRSYQERSSEIVENFVEIFSLEINPADEEGKILIQSDLLAGESGDVYEYTEGFGDGFTHFNKGALYDGSNYSTRNLITSWFYDGNDENVETDELSLADLEASYLASQLTVARDQLTGVLDVFDFIALVDGKRVNYINTDFRFGRSKIELIEIRDHDLEAIIEERKEKKIEGVVRWEIDPPLRLFNQQQAIGETTEDYINETRTSASVEIDNPVQAGGEYWIVNENEVSSTDRLAGVYPIIPQRTDEAGNVVLPDDPGYEDAIKNYGPGRLDGDAQARLPIEEQRINAPKGSLIFKGPNQNETETIVIDRRVQEGEEAIDTLNTVTLPGLQADLDQLETDLDTLNTVTLPGLQDDLDQLEADLNTLNTVTLPGLQDDLDDLNTELDDVLPITETKISDGAISTPKLQTNAVTAGKILAGSITTNKIAAGAVVADSIASNAIIANKIQSGAIITDKIGAGQIATFHLQADIITANEIGADVIRGFHIRAGEIDTEHLEANAVTANKIDVADLYATDATIGAKLNVGGVAYIGAGVDVQESNGQRALMGTTSGGIPYMRAQADNNNYVQMVGSSGQNFFEVRSGGSVVMGANSSGLTIGNNFEITNPDGDFLIGSDGGIIFPVTNESLDSSIVFRDSLPSGTVRGYLASGVSANNITLRALNSYNLNLRGDDIRITADNDILMSGPVQMLNLPISNPGGSGNLWKDGSTLRIT